VTVYVTAVGMSGGDRHQHISRIKWLDSANSTSNTMTKAQGVEWVNDGSELWVAGTDGKVEVRVVDADPPYLRTVANDTYTDNLLQLPRL
jgi:formate-dependent nitrite reductase cytochrome c552 subunit